MKLTDGHRSMVAFGLHGATVGGIYTRLPEIQQALGLSEAVYGFVQLGFSVGVFTGNTAVAPVIDRFGGRRVLLWSLPAFAALQILAAFAFGPWSLALMLVFFGIALAVGNVAINVVGSAIETATGTSIMSRLHGSWGLGFLVISTIAPGFIALGLSPAAQFGLMFCAITALTWAMIRPLPKEQPAPSERKGPRFAWPSRPVLLIGAAILAGVVFEGIARTWGVIYLRDELGAGQALAAAALPAFILTLTLARFAGDAVIARMGPVRTGRTATVITGLGGVLVAVAPGPVLALAGFALIGLGCSVAMPLGFSAAGRTGGVSVANALAAFSLLTMIVNAVGPPLFGLVAEGTGLRLAFALFLPIVAVSVWQSGRLVQEGASRG